MAKYDPLMNYLKLSGAQSLRVPLFFVEQIVGKFQAWCDAGYRAEFDRVGRAVTFICKEQSVSVPGVASTL